MDQKMTARERYAQHISQHEPDEVSKWTEVVWVVICIALATACLWAASGVIRDSQVSCHVEQMPC